jgi:amino acid permease
MNRILLPYALFAGGIIGVGVFGLPYVLTHAGLWSFLLVGGVIGLIVWVSHVAFADVVLATKGHKRLPGYAREYLGLSGEIIAVVGNILGLVGALLAYLIAGGLFLSLFLRPFVTMSAGIATLIYFAVGALILLRGVRSLPVLQLAMVALFFVTLVILGVGLAPDFSPHRVAFAGSVRDAFLPYGVLLFAFWGLSLVPEIVEMTRRSARRTRQVLAWGFLTAAVTYGVFAILVGGATGSATTEDALSGLATLDGGGVLLLAAFFGILTTFSSFLALGLNLIHTLQYDFHFRPMLAWGAAMTVPIALYILGVQQFVTTLSVTGAVFLGIEGVVVLAIAWRAGVHAKRHSILQSPASLCALAILLFAGVVGEILRVLSTG